MTEEAAAATEPGTKITEYSATAAALAELQARLKGVVYDLTTTKGLDAAKRDRRELVTLRTSLEAKRKEIKAPALAHCALIDAEAKRITAEITALEDPIDAQIKREEERRAAEKAAKEEAERRRVATIQAAIDVFRRAVADMTGKTSAEIAARRNELAATRFDEVWPAQFAEFADEAKAARDSAVIALANLQDRVKKQEDEAEQIARDRAEIAALRAAEAERAAREEAARKAREEEERKAREAREAQERAEREAREAEARRQREAEERAAAEARAAEEARLRAERERLAAERAEFERQRMEAAEAERQRVIREEAEARARLEAERKADEERQQVERERAAQQEAAARALRHRALANTTLTEAVYDLLMRCEEFIAGFDEAGFPEPDATRLVDLLADLRAALHTEPVREAA